MITEPIYLGAQELEWPSRDVLDCGKGGRLNPGLGRAFGGQFLERDLAESPNQATIGPAGETQWGGGGTESFSVN